MKLFEMKHIKKSFDGLEVLKDISLDVASRPFLPHCDRMTQVECGIL